MASSDQLQLFIPQPLANMDDKTMHMHDVSTIIWISSLVRGLKFNLLDQQLGLAFPPWLVCCILTSSLESELELGEGCKPVATSIQNSREKVLRMMLERDERTFGQVGTREWKEQKDHSVAPRMGQIIVYSRHYKRDYSNTLHVPEQANWVQFWWEILLFYLNDLDNGSLKDLDATRHSTWTSTQDKDTIYGSDMFDLNPSDSFFCQWSHSAVALALYSKGCLAPRVAANLLPCFCLYFLCGLGLHQGSQILKKALPYKQVGRINLKTWSVDCPTALRCQ